MNTIEMETDVLVVGGGTAGPMAAVKAKEANPKLRVMLLEKANVKRSGAIEYPQFKPPFVPSLSAIDLLMFNAPKDARQLLKQYALA